MSDDAEERRKQDRRDLEFFRARVRPTSSDLWRLSEKSNESNALKGIEGDDEMIWPLVASLAVFFILAWTGMAGRVASVLP